MESKPSININGFHFNWDLEKGQFQLEGQDSVLFWITSAMKIFFDTIEEISGEEASNLVLEATGFRQGILVGEYIEQIKSTSLSDDEVLELLTKIYASAGWGINTFKNFDFGTKKLTIHLKDTWEHKINVAQGKKCGGRFLAAHFAGVFTVILKTNIWYKIVQSQLEGHEYSVIDYFPSDVTVTSNIHKLSRKRENQQILELERLVEEKTKELTTLIKELSSPIIPVLDGIVVVPLIGIYDEDRSQELVDKTLTNLPSYRANYLILDLTGLDEKVNEQTAAFIEKIGAAATLIGTKTILVGISAELSVTISKLNINFSNFNAFRTLQHGIYHALGQMGKSIIENK